MITNDSLEKRYLSKLITNIIGLIISFITVGVVPRGLGPKAYGDFHFLFNFFNGAVGFVDMGTSMGFYTKLSQRQHDFGLIVYYSLYAGFASFLLFIFVGFAHLTKVHSFLWPNQELFYIYLAAALGILTWFTEILNKVVDAYGITVSTEIAKTIRQIIGVIILLALFFTERLNLSAYFYYHYVILIFLAFAFIFLSEHKGFSFKKSWKLSLTQIRNYTQEFYHYSHPLFVYTLMGLIVGVLDRWMLQMFGGSVEQGFFGFSYQIGAVCFLFTSAMTPLMMREFSIAYAQNDLKKMREMFRRFIPLLYSIAAYLGCFIAVEAEKVTAILGGGKYKEAVLAMTVMAFYPIHQTYGQLSGSVFYATGRTRLYRNIGITFMLIGLPLTYFLIAPKNMMGLNAGAPGLAFKMVFLQFIVVNIQLYANSRFLHLKFFHYLLHQIGCITALTFLAILARISIEYGLGSSNILLTFISSGITYTTMVAFLGISYPTLLGLSSNDVQLIKASIRDKIHFHSTINSQ